jgi:hypothetical protein
MDAAFLVLVSSAASLETTWTPEGHASCSWRRTAECRRSFCMPLTLSASCTHKDPYMHTILTLIKLGDRLEYTWYNSYELASHNTIHNNANWVHQGKARSTFLREGHKRRICDRC